MSKTELNLLVHDSVRIMVLVTEVLRNGFLLRRDTMRVSETSMPPRASKRTRCGFGHLVLCQGALTFANRDSGFDENSTQGRMHLCVQFHRRSENAYA